MIKFMHQCCKTKTCANTRPNSKFNVVTKCPNCRKKYGECALHYTLKHIKNECNYHSRRQSELPTPEEEVREIEHRLEQEKERLLAIRMKIAKKNRSIVTIERQLDNIPDRTELSQYQRRFLELYNQGELSDDILEICSPYNIDTKISTLFQSVPSIGKRSNSTLCTIRSMIRSSI